MPDYVEHLIIYLAPSCVKCDEQNAMWGPGDGRQWRESPQEKCDECGKEWVKYVFADVAKPKRKVTRI